MGYQSCRKVQNSSRYIKKFFPVNNTHKKSPMHVLSTWLLS
jgi:hypothetical protein